MLNFKKTIRRMCAVIPALLVAGVVALQGALSCVHTAYANDGPHDGLYGEILGEGVNYGILTNTYEHVIGDAQTNVAAVTATCKVQTGNDYTNDVVQPFILAHVPHEFRIKGSYDAYVWTNEQDESRVIAQGGVGLTVDTSRSADELANQVSGMMDHVANQSDALMDTEPYDTIEYIEGLTKYTVDLREKGAGNFVIDVDPRAYEVISGDASRLNVHLDEGQTVVFNVPGEVSRLHKFDLNGRGADSYLVQDAGDAPKTVVWNFPNTTSLEIKGSVTGVVLAPRARVVVSATSSGWLVANHVVIGSGEWHNVYQEIEDLRPDTPDTPDTPMQPEGSVPSVPLPEPRLKVRAQKTSAHDAGEPLQGATYDLWQVNPSGDDARIQSSTSNEEGLLLYDLPSTEDAEYYLLEEEAPFGYLVDPHPTDTFSIGSDEQGFYLAHEGDESSEFVRPAADSTQDTLIFDYNPMNNPVANQPVHVSVSKRDRDSSKVIAGARLQVVDEQTGEIVDEWTSAANEHALMSTLDTERVYVLRETVAPDGYELASEVRFAVHEEGTHTTGEILSGSATADGAKNATMTSGETTGVLSIALYDGRSPDLTGEGVAILGQAPGSITSSRVGKSTPLAQTSDQTPTFAAVMLLFVGAAALIQAKRVKQGTA